MQIPKPRPLMDTAAAADDDKKLPHMNHHRRTILISATIILLILITILAATLLRPKRPKTTVNAITLRNLAVSLSPLNLNISFSVNITVSNPNKVGFKYSDSSAFVDYRGQVVGQAPIPAGHISAGQSEGFYLTLTVMADRLMSNSKEVVSDLISGSIPLVTRTRISGKVIVLFVKIGVVSYAVCNMNVFVVDKSLLGNDCNYHTHFIVGSS